MPQRSNTALRYLPGLLIALLAFLYLRWTKSRPLKVTKAPLFLSQELNQRFNPSLASFWLALSKMETAGWTSSLYRFAGNPWGMKFPKVRQTVATKYGSTDWAQYTGSKDAVLDLWLWVQATKFPANVTNFDDFVKALKERNYFGNESIESYKQKVLAWVSI